MKFPLKKGWQCKAGKDLLIRYQSADPSPSIPTHRIKEKGKTVGDKKGASIKKNKSPVVLRCSACTASQYDVLHRSTTGLLFSCQYL